MKPKSIAFIGALFASLILIISLPALADCPQGDPDCSLTPPQSEPVDPGLEDAGGATAEDGDPGGAKRLEFTVPRPTYIDPIPLRSGGGSGSGESDASTTAGSVGSPGPGSRVAAPWVMAAAAEEAIASTAPTMIEGTIGRS